MVGKPADVAVCVDADLGTGTSTLGFPGCMAAGWGIVGDGHGDRIYCWEGVLGVVTGIRADLP